MGSAKQHRRENGGGSDSAGAGARPPGKRTLTQNLRPPGKRTLTENLPPRAATTAQGSAPAAEGSGPVESPGSADTAPAGEYLSGEDAADGTRANMLPAMVGVDGELDELPIDRLLIVARSVSAEFRRGGPRVRLAAARILLQIRDALEARLESAPEDPDRRAQTVDHIDVFALASVTEYREVIAEAGLFHEGPSTTRPESRPRKTQWTQPEQTTDHAPSGAGPPPVVATEMRDHGKAPKKLGGKDDIQQGLGHLQGTTVLQALYAVAQPRRAGEAGGRVAGGDAASLPLFNVAGMIVYLANRIYILDRSGHISSEGEFQHPLLKASLEPGGTYFFGKFIGQYGTAQEGFESLLRIDGGKARVVSGDFIGLSRNQDNIPLEEMIERTGVAGGGVAIIVSRHAADDTDFSSARIGQAISGLKNHLKREAGLALEAMKDNPLDLALDVVIGEAMDQIAKVLPMAGVVLDLYEKLRDIVWLGTTLNIAAYAVSEDEVDIASQSMARKLIAHVIGILTDKLRRGVKGGVDDVRVRRQQRRHDATAHADAPKDADASTPAPPAHDTTAHADAPKDVDATKPAPPSGDERLGERAPDVRPAGERAPDAPTTTNGKLGASADKVKSLRTQRAATEDPAEHRRIDAETERTLRSTRGELEQRVKQIHPTLERVDADQNLYKITVDGRDYYGTLEVLHDFDGPSKTTRDLGDRLFSQSGRVGDAEVHATGGLAGTSAQGRVNKYPGDVDLAESIRIQAKSKAEASDALVRTIQATVARADGTKGAGDTPVVFEKLTAGKYPPGHAKAGKMIVWGPEDVKRGMLTWEGPDGVPRVYTLAEALGEPGDRIVNTHWRGPIDDKGTYGEITKVMRYEAINSESGETTFATPKIGQAYQEVGFGRPQVHDTDRAKLMGALTPHIEGYAKQGDWVKAVKRAFTVARMANDTEAMDSFGRLLGSEAAELRQISERVQMLMEDVIDPYGDHVQHVPADVAKQRALDLVPIVESVDGDAAAKLRAAVSEADDVRGNDRLYKIMKDEVSARLDERMKTDAAFAERARAALERHGYLKADPAEGKQ